MLRAAVLALKLPNFALVLVILMAASVQSQNAPEHSGATPPSKEDCEPLSATRQIASHIESRGGSVSWLTGEDAQALGKVYDALQPNSAVDADVAVAISPSYDMRLLTGLIKAGTWEIRFFTGSCLSSRWTVSGETFDRASEIIRGQDAEEEADPRYYEQALTSLRSAIADEANAEQSTNRLDLSNSEETKPQTTPAASGTSTIAESVAWIETKHPIQAAVQDFCTFGLWPEDIETADLTPENRVCAEENAAREERMRIGTESVEDWEIWGAQRRARGSAARTDTCRQDSAVYQDGNGFELAFDAEESAKTMRVFAIRDMETGEIITHGEPTYVTWSNGYSVAYYVVSFECVQDWNSDCGASGRVYSLTSQPDAVADIPLMGNEAAATILFVGFGAGFYSAGHLERLGDVWRLSGCSDK